MQTGLVPEGGFDAEMLQPLLQRVLVDLCLTSPHEVDVPAPLDMRDRPGFSRSPQRVAQLFEEKLELDVLFVHCDGRAHPEVERRRHVEPIIDLVPTKVVAVVPVHETEAWVLADRSGVARCLRVNEDRLDSWPSPGECESDPNPKETLRVGLATVLSRRRRRPFPARTFGEVADLPTLRRLPSFSAFESDLSAALELLDFL